MTKSKAPQKVFMTKPDGSWAEYSSLTQAAHVAKCSRNTMKRALDSGKPLSDGTIVANHLPADMPAVMPDPNDGPLMEPEQLFWCAEQLRLHAKDLVAHAKLLEKQAKED